MDKNIIVLFGGTSDERLVSVASAQFVAKSLINPTLWFLDKNNKIYNINIEELLSHKNPFLEEFKSNNIPIFNNLDQALLSKEADEKVFFLCLHGGFEENGSLQAIFEKYHRPFTGSSSKASALAFNKLKTKEVLENHKVRLAKQYHGDFIVKPICGGSSLGVIFLNKKDYFIEEIIKGKEITVGVLEDENGLRALACTEIITDNQKNFDYEQKYTNPKTKEITPANITKYEEEACKELALLAHKALGLKGYSRTDIMLDEKGPVYLETNTLPGLSESSLFPKQLSFCHISMRDFVLLQVKMAKMV